MPQRGVNVSGLAEVRRDLRRLGDAEELKEVRDALKHGAEIVAADARRRVGGTGRTAASIRGTAGGNKAYVVGGKASVPYYGWLDFGSRKAKTGQPRSVGPWAGTGKGPLKGRFIYPAIGAKSDEVARFVGQAIDRVARRMDFQ
jgi:hypothetical protein